MPDTVNMHSGIGGNFRRYKQIVIAYGVMLLYNIAFTIYQYSTYRTIPNYSDTPINGIIFDMLDWVQSYVIGIIFIILYSAWIVLLLRGRFDRSIVILPRINVAWLILLFVLKYIFVDKVWFHIGIFILLWLIGNGIELLLALIVSAIVFMSYKRVTGLQELREASDGI